MSTQLKDALVAVKQLRDLVGKVVEHIVAGGRITRQDAMFFDLKHMHRYTRDSTVWEHISRLEGVVQVWQVLADSMLEAGGTEVTSFACAVAKELGIELRETVDGGRTWRHVREVQLQTRHLTVTEMVDELRRRYPTARFIDLANGRPATGIEGFDALLRAEIERS